jgi:NTE family protein
MSYPFRNLVFEGGGVKGIAYAGAMEVLEKKGIMEKITRVGGTSAGAINALLLGLNYSLGDTRQILSSMNFNNFLDDSWGLVRDFARLLNEFGWYQGNFCRNWIAELIGRKTGNGESTFKDVYDQKEKKGFKDVYIIGTNLSTRFSEVFSYEHTPRMPMADAVRISMSIPLFFAAKRSPRGDVYVDGGVLDNYPVKLFDRKKYIEDQDFEAHSRDPKYYGDHNQALKQLGREISPYVYNKETLGFRLDSEGEIAVFRDQAEPPQQKIDDFFSYAWGLIETIMEGQANQHLHSDDWQRTIYINTLGVKTTEFDLSDEKKEALVESGREKTRKYFEWYDNPEENPVNRVEKGGGP